MAAAAAASTEHTFKKGDLVTLGLALKDDTTVDLVPRAPPAAAAAAAAAPTKIATHDGWFHADETTAIGMLLILPRFADAVVTRTRDNKVLATQDIVVDVGGVYDTAKHRYDHHQSTCKETFDAAHNTPLSSAGMVYKHFGREIIHTLVPSLTSAELDIMHVKVYNEFVEALDAHDNGKSQYPPELRPAFKIPTALPQRVFDMNIPWDEKKGETKETREAFDKTVVMCATEFKNAVKKAAKGVSDFPKVKEAYQKRFEFHKSGRLMCFDSAILWQKHIHEIEDGKGPEVLYVVSKFKDEDWRIGAVPLFEGSFISRQKLPVAWRGLMGDSLVIASGIKDAIFCHKEGFMGGNKTFEGVSLMATKALAVVEDMEDALASALL